MGCVSSIPASNSILGSRGKNLPPQPHSHAKSQTGQAHGPCLPLPLSPMEAGTVLSFWPTISAGLGDLVM